MRRLPLPALASAATFALAHLALLARPAWAEEPPRKAATSAESRAGAGAAPTRNDPEDRIDDPTVRARRLLDRARTLDEGAARNEAAARDVELRLPKLRADARAAREAVNRAPVAARASAEARAEDLEADVAVSESELTLKRRLAVEQRRQARELRSTAITIAKDGVSAGDAATRSASSEDFLGCARPLQLSPDGSKVFRIECFR